MNNDEKNYKPSRSHSTKPPLRDRAGSRTAGLLANSENERYVCDVLIILVAAYGEMTANISASVYNDLLNSQYGDAAAVRAYDKRSGVEVSAQAQVLDAPEVLVEKPEGSARAKIFDTLNTRAGLGPNRTAHFRTAGTSFHQCHVAA